MVELEKARECSCCGSRVLYGLWKCPKFISLHVDERRAFVKQGKYCFCCLKTGHLAKECTGKFHCRECGLSHNSLLHTAKRVQDVRKEETKGNTMITNATAVCRSEIDSSEGKDGGECKGSSRPRTRLKVLPVEVVNEQSGHARKVLSFLDGGVDCHLIRRDLYDNLGLIGDPVKSKIGLTDGTSDVEETYVTNLLVRGLGNAAAAGTYELTSVIVKEELADVGTSAPTPEDFERNAHFVDVEIPFLERDKIDLIIGLNARILHEIHDKREAGSDRLCAGRCVLGWFLYGNDATVDHMEESNWTRSASFVTSHIVAPKYESPFSKRDLCPICLGSGRCLDCKGSGSGKLDVDHREPSLNDDRAQSILDKTCTFVHGHYQIGLLWASEDSSVPDNCSMAKIRLGKLGKRLNENPDVWRKYKEKFQDMIDEGHVVEIPDRSLGAVPGRTFYIPHHNVSGGKFRIVMDCAAKYQGISLNSVLLRGPDNFNSLLGVLFRFRTYPVAVVADIKSMFFQVRALRFLFWEDGDPNKEIKVYQSTVQCFGLTCSPCVANYALNRCAVDNQLRFSDEAIQNVKFNFYVDDWLTGAIDVPHAVALNKEVDQLLGCAGFRLMKFSSNEPKVLEGIDNKRLSPHVADIQFQGGDIPDQKSLGMIWRSKEDLLRVQISENDYAMTRRGLLAFESRIFDPLGILEPFKLPAKLILRDLAKMGFDWDDKNLPPDIMVRWDCWVRHLNRLDGVSLPRHHFNLHKAKTVELHGFADASKVGYGIIYYLRIYDGEDIHLSYIVGKSKVLSSICSTIPRAELHAALELVVFSHTIIREHKLKFDRVIFWSDSQTVLGYLKNPNKRLPVFECNRVKKIFEGSSPNQWRWVDTAQNPADAFSRGVSPSRPSAAEKWLNGPSYLLKEEDEWPIPRNKQACFVNVSIVGNTHSVLASEAIDINCDCSPQVLLIANLLLYYSSLPRLLRAVSWWRRVIALLCNRVYRRLGKTELSVPTGPILVSEYDSLLLVVIRIVQKESFPGVLETLEVGNCHDIDAGKYGDKLRKVVTPLRKFCPFLHDNVLRVGGRLQKSEFSFDVKHSIVLPRRHHVTGLIVIDAHVKCGHFAANYVLNELLLTYHIVGGKATVIHYLKKLCMECRNRNARLFVQQLAPLPTGRVTVRHFPFEHCGIDYMCGLKVKQGRNELKRYACIFTCLCTRATHLEVVHDLTTESFVMAYRRFLAVTGSVTKTFYSDNGSNFRGAAVELKRGLERLNRKYIVGELAQIGVQFRFNPPLSSHQGGVFEAIIRLVRKTLTAIMDDRKLRTLTEAGLETLLREVQMILNCRPLTRACSDPNDMRALCPQNILTGAVKDIFPPDVFTASDGLRASYRLSQAYAEEFWKRS